MWRQGKCACLCRQGLASAAFLYHDSSDAIVPFGQLVLHHFHTSSFLEALSLELMLSEAGNKATARERRGRLLVKLHGVPVNSDPVHLSYRLPAFSHTSITLSTPARCPPARTAQRQGPQSSFLHSGYRMGQPCSTVQRRIVKRFRAPGARAVTQA
ncbi:hypothetical protein Anapl_17703 [Anas platyrhynchos]|uniref:Uncharacterized protein n=1 Tax=Anas platyrhynchos TaxID=8839 RepID=R0L8F3_ANAPL|nr:hypothetical protein Anapl_17703 [Anas platyrhynchos]